MTNRELIARVEAGKATDGQRRTYAARVRALKDPPACKHGHYECALVERGPCLDETLAACADEGAA